MNNIVRFIMKKWLFLLAIFCLCMTMTFCTNTRKLKSAEAGNYEILTPRPGPNPHINGPFIYGCRPGHPFLYRIPCQGERPISFSAEALPRDLILDPVTGIITGNTPVQGEYNIVFNAKNKYGTDKRSFKIVAGEKLALTPPMGWNHWYAHFDNVTDKIMREAADVMISSGMADVGYQYVNIDDCWMNAPKNRDSLRVGPLRDEMGNIIPNRHFPDMKGLADYIHQKGLKAGLYSSPGPLTCARFAGSYQHEEQDARQFALWGYDFLKYDWCSYKQIALAKSAIEKNINSNKSIDNKITITRESFQYPFRLMGELLMQQDRDIVYNLCQYGMGKVWEWGGAVGASCWRTSGDLGPNLDKVFEVALKNAEHGKYSKPGEWNDPDYIQIGWIHGDESGPTKMLPSMQYAFMSLWSLMASPLFFSGDMTKLDEFTLNILCNTEVIDVNQDPLGESASVINHPDSCFIMVKNLSDGSKAVGFFNRGRAQKEVTGMWSELKLEGKQKVRDLWRQRNLGVHNRSFNVKIPSQGVVMVKISPKL